MNYLSIVAVMKDELKNLPEWLEFHRNVGVEHFYLYDNNSSDATWGYIKDNEFDDISYFRTDMDMCQMSCYFNALTAFRDQSRWMAFIDLDEFLYSPKGDLKTQLKDFEQFAGIAVNEVFYGSNGHKTRPEGGILKNYTKRRKSVDKHIKTICQPQATICSAFNPHSFYYLQGGAVDENKVPCRGPYNPKGTTDIFRINHYWVKSEEEYEKKLTRGRADVPSRDPQFRYTTGIGRKLHEVMAQDNEIEDTEILNHGTNKNN
tara:strand:+ start:391 stop:1173 length:783 start_codon:yes stop_codon:yes gene_type:complete